MKRFQFISLITLILISISFHQLLADRIDVHISGTTEEIESFEENDIEYISLSELVEILGGHLDWVIVGHKVKFIDGNNHFIFDIDSPYFKLNDSIFNITYPVLYKKGKLFVSPLTFIKFLDRTLPQKIIYSESQNNITINSEYFNVTDFSASKKANGLLIEIFLTNSMNYEVYLSEGNWVNVVIRDGILNSSKILSHKNSRYMYKLKTHQANNSGQISFRLKRNITKWHHKLEFDPPRIQLAFNDINFELEAEDSQPTIGPDKKVDVIVIDPGHGGKDYGAIGQKGTREKDVVLKISKELAKLIRDDKQFKVIMTRDQDKTISLEKRAKIANDASADLFISIHANSSPKKHVKGWNVFFLAQAKNDSARSVAQFENSAFLKEQYYEDEEGNPEGIDPILSILNEMIMTEFQSESHDLAMMIDREFRRNIKIPARGVDQAGFFVLNKVYTPSVLIESGFISNKEEEKLLKSKKYHKKIAKAIYKAI
ncbi:MAG: N-acetylmuramoyl-L-alanine amidase, partial [candidate division Zixibacteria bacterium]|nr:N-acetylmuramoyl-L-alanine amidase [candidate division Zixibacteria bacterium]